MYRPTVRYDEVFRDYVDTLFQVTHLDRNQIMRAALFAAAFSDEFKALLEPYQKDDVPLPSPPWSLEQYGFWLEQCPKVKREERDVNVNSERERKDTKTSGVNRRREAETQIRRIGPAARRERAIPSQSIRVTGGGISFTLD